ncbi:cation channel sperm-associated auxiliary subunit gamma isoform X4 [Anolis carolinensis]|uniref:cation channel sperm-associated auxiliary subunit gamma isoform X4 n=1 Tax=Anolis carolinensis TaxID=28377 RepID=UPI000462D9A0|nr:PREDICTED: cation channel sperm-associated protein subunit gamma isoform X3 [Anolis carolinensis]|eukprot:XP_008118135.1 PREDICTED: cation channel sperm-associated protein subunit gamma isoform X3 [Anolis carolinensis]
MWRILVANVLLFLRHPVFVVLASDCQWMAVVNRFNNLGGDRNIFSYQHEFKKVNDVFKELVDSAIDADDKHAKYLGFPYYLKINLTCSTLDSEMALRTAHYTGLRPVVTVTFEEPVHSVRRKQEQLQIKMTAAPFRMRGCDSEEVCRMCWFTPMPFMNGSVVMDVIVASNHLGIPVDDKRFSININGYMKKNRVSFKIGLKLTALNAFMSLKHRSRPLWHTHIQAPVLILGDIPRSKVVLLSDTGYDDYFPIEVGIDSCWIGTMSCRYSGFSSTVRDSISTESTLFIRQNQLVYYFVGHYPILHMRGPGSKLWTRIMNDVCVKRLNPVFFSGNNSEYVIVLGEGANMGDFFLITIQDGIVNSSGSMRVGEQTVCQFLQYTCDITWVIFSTSENKFFLLVKEDGTNYHSLLEFQKDTYYKLIYDIPRQVPRAASDGGFVLLLGNENYTNRTLISRGLALNPFSKIFYIWGNVILQSNDMASYIYLSNFPGDSAIKYFVMSFTGHIAFVTDTDEVWVMKEGSTEIKKAYPSKAWSMYNTLQVMEGSPDYELKANHSLVSVFFDKDGMQELIYREDPGTTGRIIKRKFPLDHILTYDQMISTPHKGMTHNGIDYIRFTHRCPFAVLRFVDLPFPQRFTRMEHYRANPPEVMEKTNFHDVKALIVYQGLVYQLLHLHSAYHRSYADPVHDPTWRWWKNKKQDAEYYYYLASNGRSSGGMYVDMANYVKIYNLRPNNVLPKTIYLDKKQTFFFSVYLSIRTTKQSMGETAEENSLNYMWLTILLAHPEYIRADLERHELISRGSVLYKVAHSGMNCYDYTDEGPHTKGSDTIGINIGCPPGRRLAFDITYTKNYTGEKNKRYFDCVEPDPEMPCFYYNDVFYPFFLIQDMVTGHSGRFNGSYIFSIIGGGAFSVDNIRYFNTEEILQYNTMNGRETYSLIWLRADGEENMTSAEGFHVLSQASSGILWVCQQNSPCYDIIPTSTFTPDFFFVLKVSNRGVDQTTYCDYALEFIVHIHGLPLSHTRALYLLKMSMAAILSLLVLYVVTLSVGPKAKVIIGRFFRTLEQAIVFRAASSLTFNSSFTSQTSLQHATSEITRSHLAHKSDVPGILDTQ